MTVYPGARKRATALTACVVAAACLGLLCAPVTTHAQDADYSLPWLQGEYQKAVEILETRLERYSNFLPPHLAEDYGELLMEVGRVDEAIAVYESLLERYQEPQYAVELAEAYRYRGRMEDFEATVARADSIAQRALQFGIDQEGFLGVAELGKLKGENPKELLKLRYKVLIEQRPNFVDAYIAAGELAYKAHGYDVAADYFNQALERAPNNQDAIAGLAACYFQSGDPRLDEEALPRLFDLNEHHPGGLAIEARQLLNASQPEEALEIIDARLEVNPNDLEFLGFKAAAHFIQDNIDAMKAAQDQATAFNPRSSEVYRIPGEVAMLQYRFADAEKLLRAAVQRDEGDNAARAELGFAVLRQGRNAEGRELLETAQSIDPYDVQVYNMLEVLDSVDTFTTVERGPFVMNLPEYEARLMGDATLDLLEEAYTYYIEKYDVEMETPLYVEMFKEHDEFMVRSIGLPGNAGHLGICFGQLMTLDSPRARPPGSTNWEAVVWHEFVHMITLQKTNNRMPRWLSEGISVYEETIREPHWGQPMEIDFKQIVVDDGFPTMNMLNGYFLRPRSAQHLMYGYFAAGEFAEFYIETYGQAAMNQALDAIGDGEEPITNLAKAAGLDMDALDAAFNEHMTARCASLEVLPHVDKSPQTEEEAQIIALTPQVPWLQKPSPFTDAMNTAMQFEQDGEFDKAIEKLREAHELYPDFVSTSSPLYRIANILRDEGRDEEYYAVLEEIVAWDNTAFNPARDLAGYYAAEGRWDKVMEMTEAGYAVNPFDLPLRMLMLQAYRELDHTEEALNALDELAYLDKSRSTEYRFEHADLLADSGRLLEAKVSVIKLLEELPHYWAAQELLLDIVTETEEALFDALD